MRVVYGGDSEDEDDEDDREDDGDDGETADSGQVVFMQRLEEMSDHFPSLSRT